jgi:hypothetical protein
MSLLVKNKLLPLLLKKNGIIRLIRRQLDVITTFVTSEKSSFAVFDVEDLSFLLLDPGSVSDPLGPRLLLYQDPYLRQPRVPVKYVSVLRITKYCFGHCFHDFRPYGHAIYPSGARGTPLEPPRALVSRKEGQSHRFSRTIRWVICDHLSAEPGPWSEKGRFIWQSGRNCIGRMQAQRAIVQNADKRIESRGATRAIRLSFLLRR